MLKGEQEGGRNRETGRRGNNSRKRRGEWNKEKKSEARESIQGRRVLERLEGGGEEGEKSKENGEEEEGKC